jgi:beta-1,4-mannosyltransferase
VGRFDVFHVHWPDVLVRGRTPMRGSARSLLYLLVLVRLRLQRKALVRTLHDLAPYDPLPPIQRWVIRLSDRWTTLWITLTDLTPPPRPAPTIAAPIGHYRDWFARIPRTAPAPGRIVHFGLIRRYKGIESLLSAFAGLNDDQSTLRIVGYPQDRETAVAIEEACHADFRVSVVSEYVPDDQLVREVTESELVVLPFDRLTNSSSLILALSLDRPVLVPSTPITEEVADEVGPGWVLTYRGGLEAHTIAQALETAGQSRDRPPPDLSRREWDVAGAQHAVAFARAVTIARTRGRWRHGGGRAEGISGAETI